MRVSDLTTLLTSGEYQLLFAVYEENGVITRVRLPYLMDENSALDFILGDGIRLYENGMDSGSIKLHEAKYIDCY